MQTLRSSTEPPVGWKEIWYWPISTRYRRHRQLSPMGWQRSCCLVAMALLLAGCATKPMPTAVQSPRLAEMGVLHIPPSPQPTFAEARAALLQPWYAAVVHDRNFAQSCVVDQLGKNCWMSLATQAKGTAMQCANWRIPQGLGTTQRTYLAKIRQREERYFLNLSALANQCADIGVPACMHGSLAAQVAAEKSAVRHG